MNAWNRSPARSVAYPAAGLKTERRVREVGEQVSDLLEGDQGGQRLMLADVTELGQVLGVGEPVTLDDNVAGLLNLVQAGAVTVLGRGACGG
jgi:hypothetical protein